PAVRTLDDLKAAAREARERGFKALKTNVLLFDDKGARQFAPGMLGAGAGHPELNLGDEVLAALIDQLAALREGAGKGVRLLLDLNFNYKPEGLRRIAKAVEPFDLLWLEMDLFEPKALSLIRQSTTTPIASLETILGRRNLKPYLENYSVDVAIIDAQWNGLVEATRMAAMADAYEVNVASHNFNGPLANIMSAHFCAAIFLAGTAAQVAAAPLIPPPLPAFLQSNQGVESVRWRHRHYRDSFWSGRGEAGDGDSSSVSSTMRSLKSATPGTGSEIFGPQ